jgi:hypothetical protein
MDLEFANVVNKSEVRPLNWRSVQVFRLGPWGRGRMCECVVLGAGYPALAEGKSN